MLKFLIHNIEFFVVWYCWRLHTTYTYFVLDYCVSVVCTCAFHLKEFYLIDNQVCKHYFISNDIYVVYIYSAFAIDTRDAPVPRYDTIRQNSYVYARRFVFHVTGSYILNAYTISFEFPVQILHLAVDSQKLVPSFIFTFKSI